MIIQIKNNNETNLWKKESSLIFLKIDPTNGKIIQGKNGNHPLTKKL
jgi:hypothetical protein